VLAVLFAILMAVIAYFGYRFVNQLVDEYTATAPRDLPKVEMPAEQRKILKDRVEAFRDAVKAGTPTEPLELTSNDLNALIEEEPDLKGKIYVKIDGSEIKGQVSFPLEKIGLSMFKGRYLNGEADLKASLSDGILIVTLDSFEVNGKRPPDNVMTQIRQENLAKDAYKNPQNAEMLRKIESLEVKDGKIILKVRAKAASSTSPSSETATKKESPAKAVTPPAAEKTKSEPAKTETPKIETPKANAEPAPVEGPTPKS
jgi:hypothetical protein